MTLTCLGAWFLLADVVERLVVGPLARALPRARGKILLGWSRINYRTVLGTCRWIARARFDIHPRIPCRGGVLVVMNHQSLLDIPVSFASVPEGWPCLVTRSRYARGIPLVSHMVRLYGHIPVQPGRTGRAELDKLAATAAACDRTVVIFPEGHRTRDGEMRPWKRAGLEALLDARAWTVYGVVVDGLWRSAGLGSFVSGIYHTRCRVDAIGPLEYDGRGRPNHDAFIDELRQRMCDNLADMRAHASEDAIRSPGDGRGAVRAN